MSLKAVIKKGQIITALFLCLIVSACTHPATVADIERDAFLFRMEFVEQPILHGKEVRAYATWNDYACTVTMKNGDYPGCLLHEMRHCIEGSWHPGMNTTEDCQ